MYVLECYTSESTHVPWTSILVIVIVREGTSIDDMPLCNWKKCDAAIFSNEVGATKSINTERGIALIAIPQKQTLRNMKKKKGGKVGVFLSVP